MAEYQLFPNHAIRTRGTRLEREIVAFSCVVHHGGGGLCCGSTGLGSCAIATLRSTCAGLGSAGIATLGIAAAVVTTLLATTIALAGGSGSAIVALFGSAVALAKELQVIDCDFSSVLLYTILSGIGTGTKTAFDVELGAFADEFFGYVGLLPPGHDVVPLGVFAELTAAVAVALGGGKGKCCDFSAGAICAVSIKVTYFGVSANVTD